MAQYIVASTFDKWYVWAGASARGYRNNNDMTFGSRGLTQVDDVALANDWFQFQGTVLQSASMPSTAIINRYRIFWRQEPSTDPCGWNTNIWSQWASSYRFSIGPDSITDSNDGYPGYNITYGFSTGNYLLSSTYPADDCPSVNLNCCIDSNTFDPSISRFTSGDANKSLASPTFWNNTNNLFAGFAVPTEVSGKALSNFIGPPSAFTCCGAGRTPDPTNIEFLFVVDYTDTGVVVYRRRYYISYTKYSTDATSPATTTGTTTTVLTTTSTTITTTTAGSTQTESGAPS